MKIIFRRSFLKDLRGIDKSWKHRVEHRINEVEQAEPLQVIRNLKRLSGEGPYYRIRMEDYRIGLKVRQKYCRSVSSQISQLCEGW